MTEGEWRSSTFALLLMQAADGFDLDTHGCRTWRSVAARVACLNRLGEWAPDEVRRWLRQAEIFLEREDRTSSAGEMISHRMNRLYSSFREAYEQATPEVRQLLAAAQDVYRGPDYYAEEGYMLEEDETSETYTGSVYTSESAAHCDIIRDIFGNQFNTVAFSPTWRTEAVVALARGMYEGRDFAAMPVLADALDDAGCDHPDVLAHCRGAGPHVRGCWVVDLVLGKA